ncbi:MAG: alanyl-tRNA editing protein [bacterium]|nr:alanyl-tRNA editing protein [bacterium]
MTVLIYQTDSYIKEFEAKITGIVTDGNAVILDRTAFYPGGGGQPCDHGEIFIDDQRFEVRKVKMQKGIVYHYVTEEISESLSGSDIKGVIDWDRRYKLMRTHSAFHVLCGVIWHVYGASVTGGNMEPLKGRMDFEFETMKGELVREIEDKVNLEIEQDYEVKVNILPREEAFEIPDLIRTKINLLPPMIKEVRTIEIVGLDLQADGGTHVKNTSEIGKISIPDYHSKGRINKRIFMEVTD